VQAWILHFALDELRRRYGHLVPDGLDPRHETAPFRIFREALLAEAARAATGPAELRMWWEGTFNGYCLVVSCEPAEALPGLRPAAVCAPEAERVADAPAGGYPLGRVAPGRYEVGRDAEGASYEAPFGAPAGHFGAPGVRRVA